MLMLDFTVDACYKNIFKEIYIYHWKQSLSYDALPCLIKLV